MATVNDVRRALPAMVKAFWTFPETVHLLPNERIRRLVLPRYLTSDLVDARRYGGLRVEEVDGSVAGALAFLPPGAYPIGALRQVRALLPLVTVAPIAVAAALEGQRGSSHNAARHRAHDEPHYFLRAIGVDPSRQRKGIGSRLIQPVLDQADAEGVGCFLFTATEANAAWYNSLGFDTDEVYRPTPRWPQVWAMWRAPR